MAFPFPSAYPNLIITNPALDTLLALDMAAAQATYPTADLSRVAISIAEPAGFAAVGYRHAGLKANETHYAASMLKAAAMYAAFELRKACGMASATSRAATAAALLAELKARFDGDIEAEVADLRIASLPGPSRVPKYGTIFTPFRPSDGIWRIAFSKTFETSMRLMIVNGSNVAAASCITALGYSWINGALRNGGFFRAAGKSGIWLAGTFTGSLPYVRIPSVNDGAVAQASTSIDMANLYAHIFDQTLVDGPSSRAMLALLLAAQAKEPSWLTPRRRPRPVLSFTPTHTKIGLGPLKTGSAVYSEGTLVTHSSGKSAVVVFSNAFANSLDAVAELVHLYLSR